VKQIPIPEPKKGEVLVKVMATPLNHSDIAAMKGKYDDIIYNFEYPMAHGNECAGIVVKNGGDMIGSRVMGKRVACSRK